VSKDASDVSAFAERQDLPVEIVDASGQVLPSLTVHANAAFLQLPASFAGTHPERTREFSRHANRRMSRRDRHDDFDRRCISRLDRRWFAISHQMISRSVVQDGSFG
jgi:hypothetical protein